MNEFRSSNGATVTRHIDSVDIRRGDAGEWLEPWEVVAIREWVIAEEDERLGRWRWLDTPYVVYPENDNTVLVLHEGDPECHLVRRGEGYLSAELDQFVKAGDAYFDAHPEPKPWHNAQEGEVWIITYDGTEYPAIYQADAFRDHGGMWSTSDITAARRIYPEDDS